jgi:hypothetical protein
MIGDGLTIENDVTQLRTVLSDWNKKNLPLQKRVGKLMDFVVDDKKKDKFHFKSGSDYVIDTPVKQEVKAKPEKKK